MTMVFNRSSIVKADMDSECSMVGRGGEGGEGL